MTPGRILIVEDNPTARKLYRVTLQAEGYDVVEADDAKTALESLERDRPALVLLDLLLPDSRGLELLEKIRALPYGRELPIVALSGFRSILEEAKVLPLGFDATLVKPVERSSLLATVRSLLPNLPREVEPIGRGHRVLLVDDDSVQLKLVRLRLLDAGFEVMGASSGSAALAFARRDKPALILADVLMPEMDGFELCAAARREPTLADVPIVLMSAHFVDASDGELARRVGAHSLALRTPTLAEVLSAVASALESVQLPPSRDGEFPRADHKARLAHRLKQLAALNAALLQRCAQQAAQLSIVGGVADALAKSEDVDAVLQDILGACLDAGGISKGALFRENADGAMTPDQAVGFSEEQRAVLASKLVDPTIVDVVANGRPVRLSAFMPREELAELAEGAGVTSSIFVPIMVEGHCRAALFLACGDAELSEEDLLAFGRAIGAYVAQALTLSRAFGRLNATAEANRVLFSSLDIDETLQALGELVTSQLGELCEIDLVEDDQTLRHAVIAHSDPARDAIVREMHRRYPPNPTTALRYRVLRSKRSELRTEKTDAMRVAMAEDEEHLRMLRAIGLRSHMAVPMLLKGRVVGLISIGTSRAGRRYGKADLAIAEEIAASAAIAVENARLYHVAQAASRAKDEFLATVSHELRTPLNAMLGWTRILRTGSLSPPKREKALASIERNAVAQTQLIADILDVSGIIAGKLKLSVQKASLAEVVEAALDSVRLAMEAKEIRCHCDLEAGLDVVCDPARIQQVIWNLVSNAIKFTPNGGSLGVTAGRRGSQIELCVTDSGQGISEDFLSRVFERFQQADGSITRAHGGLGLGLAISRHIVELHGGTIEAHSEGPGKGALFRVMLPVLAESRLVVDGDDTGSPPKAGAALPQELVGLRILVVDDDPDARELLVTLFEDTGAVVAVVQSVVEALSHLRQERYDVLISDIGMPEADGLDLIRAVRSLPSERGRAMPALALTAYAGVEQRRAALLAGYQVHLVKPVEPGELMATVATLARMAALTR